MSTLKKARFYAFSSFVIMCQFTHYSKHRICPGIQFPNGLVDHGKQITRYNVQIS